MPPEPGLKIHTNTEKTRRIRKVVLELLLANHDRECTTCSKSGNCELQQYAQEYGITDIRFAKKKEEDYLPIDDSNPSIVRDPNKCILCGACVRACSEFQGHSVLGFANRGSKTVVQPMAGKALSSVDCVFCGQCQAVCPTGALTIKTDIEDFKFSCLEVPVLAQYYILPSLCIEAGPTFVTTLSSSPDEIFIPNFEETSTSITDLTIKTGEIKAFDVMLSAGVGYKHRSGFTANARYNLGMSELAGNFAGKVSTISVSIGWLFKVVK